MEQPPTSLPDQIAKTETDPDHDHRPGGDYAEGGPEIAIRRVKGHENVSDSVTYVRIEHQAEEVQRQHAVRQFGAEPVHDQHKRPPGKAIEHARRHSETEHR